jgi:hypothetical protein
MGGNALVGINYPNAAGKVPSMHYGLVFRDSSRDVVFLGKFSILGIIDKFEAIEDPDGIYESLSDDQFVFVHVIESPDSFALNDIYTLTMSTHIYLVIYNEDFIPLCMKLYEQSLARMEEDDIYFDDDSKLA